jgi:hypothetical protein
VHHVRDDRDAASIAPWGVSGCAQRSLRIYCDGVLWPIAAFPSPAPPRRADAYRTPSPSTPSLGRGHHLPRSSPSVERLTFFSGRRSPCAVLVPTGSAIAGPVQDWVVGDRAVRRCAPASGKGSEDRGIMATCAEQDKTMPDRVVKAQALHDMKQCTQRVENTPNREKP